MLKMVFYERWRDGVVSLWGASGENKDQIGRTLGDGASWSVGCREISRLRPQGLTGMPVTANVRP